MKLAIFHHHLLAAAKERGTTPAEEYRHAREAGISAIDINLDDLTAAPGLPAELAACGLRIASVHAYYRFAEQEEGARIALHMQTAAACGAERVMLVPDFFAAGEIPEESRKNPDACADFFDKSPRAAAIIAGMREAVRVGAEHGITVTVEDYDHRDSPTATSTQIQYFLDRVEGLAFTFDTGNFAFFDEDLMAAFDALGDKTVYLHCKDRAEEAGWQGEHTKGLAACAVGAGYLPIRELISRLAARGYDGYLAIEHFAVADYAAATAASLRFLSDCIG